MVTLRWLCAFLSTTADAVGGGGGGGQLTFSRRTMHKAANLRQLLLLLLLFISHFLSSTSELPVKPKLSVMLAQLKLPVRSLSISHGLLISNSSSFLAAAAAIDGY